VRLAIVISLLLGLCPRLNGQLAKTYQLGTASTAVSLPGSNSVSDIFVKRDTVWLGTDKGLSQTTDRGLTFKDFGKVEPFSADGISAIAMNDGVIWVATATSFTQDNQSIPQGAGLDYSTDRGLTWNHVPQPVDVGLVDTIQYGISRIKTLDITTTANNITYDLALTSTAVWSASFAGMLRKSTDNGATWQRVVLPPDAGADSIAPNDSLDFDLSPSSGRSGLRQNLNHRVFSVFADGDSAIWVGTAGGINKSTDGGVSWVKFSHQNQAQPISGNFVVAINQMRVAGKKLIWAATVNAEKPDEERGVSYSDDGGTTWKTTLLGEFAHNISFKDSIVYVATDNGLFRSSDFGDSWVRNGTIYDPVSLQRLTASAMYATASLGDTIWAAGPDGIAYTLDSNSSAFGTQWKVFRTYRPVASSSVTYSYPLPFSPNQEVVRIHYGVQGADAPVTIRVFDFAMHPVRVLLRDAVRSSLTEHDEIWDGNDDHGRRVTNGVYFYRVEIGNKSPLWGKIMVIQ
jgi:hypothetical protein